MMRKVLTMEMDICGRGNYYNGNNSDRNGDRKENYEPDTRFN